MVFKEDMTSWVSPEWMHRSETSLLLQQHAPPCWSLAMSNVHRQRVWMSAFLQAERIPMLADCTSVIGHSQWLPHGHGTPYHNTFGTRPLFSSSAEIWRPFCSGRRSLMQSDNVLYFICSPVVRCWSVTMYWLLQTDFVDTKSSRSSPSSTPSGILIHPAIWPQQIWAENWGGAPRPFGEGGAGSPSKTMWPGPRPTCMQSFIMIRPTVWPEYTNVTDRTGQRQDRQDGGPIA